MWLSKDVFPTPSKPFTVNTSLLVLSEMYFESTFVAKLREENTLAGKYSFVIDSSSSNPKSFITANAEEYRLFTFFSINFLIILINSDE